MSGGTGAVSSSVIELTLSDLLALLGLPAVVIGLVRLSQESGAVRVSLVHYNTVEEIHRFANVLLDLSKND